MAESAVYLWTQAEKLEITWMMLSPGLNLQYTWDCIGPRLANPIGWCDQMIQCCQRRGRSWSLQLSCCRQHPPLSARTHITLVAQLLNSPDFFSTTTLHQQRRRTWTWLSLHRLAQGNRWGHVIYQTFQPWKVQSTRPVTRKARLH